MKVMVTGGAGFIGSHTVKALMQRGHEVVIFDNFSSGRRELVLAETVVEGDLDEAASIKKALREHPCEAVFHFASLIQVGESFVHPQKYYTQNLVGGLNLLDAMLAAGVKRLIFSSSAAVYGVPKETPISESHILAPANPYGQTKFFLECMLQDYDRAYDVKFISLRYFNASGADPDGQLGEMHDPETHLVPNILLAGMGVKKDFEIYGNDFATPDGTAVRDYIHVSDLAEAHVLALEKLSETGRSDFINLGSNRGYSVMEVIQKAEEVLGKPVPFRIGPRRKGDVPVLLASKEKAEKLLGWRLQHSDIKTIISTAMRWHEKRIGS